MGESVGNFYFKNLAIKVNFNYYRNIAQKKRFDDKVTITQTNVDDSQALFCTCRSHYHRN